MEQKRESEGAVASVVVEEPLERPHHSPGSGRLGRTAIDGIAIFSRQSGALQFGVCMGMVGGGGGGGRNMVVVLLGGRGFST